MGTLFAPRVRDKAIELACSNLLWVGQLMPAEVAQFMGVLQSYDDSQLVEVVIHTKLLLNSYLERHWVLN